jgi:esterase/lipase
MAPLAKYLNSHGVSVYVVRLRGHGTSPEQLNSVELKDWITSFDRAYTVMRHRCEQLILGGFSAGGVMALLAAANKANHVQGVFTINAAIKLQDIRSKFASSVTAWNRLLDKCKFSIGKLEYIENDSENPDVNYSRNYLKGVQTLGQLIARCYARLDHVIAPALIIQGDEDPVVKPESAEVIAKAIRSDTIKVEMLPCKKHIMVTEGDERVFESVLSFIQQVKSISGANQALKAHL